MQTAEHQHTVELFGTRVRLLVNAAIPPPLSAHVSVAHVEARLREIHNALTRFDPESELSRLNQRAGEAVRVSPTLLAGITAAVRAAELSHGLVDPTILPELERAGYNTSRAGIAAAPLLDALTVTPAQRPARPRAEAAWRRIEICARERIVRLPHDVRIDLGGTGKGMAVDQAAQLLAGAPAFAVDAGGDIRIGGAHGLPRAVEIEHPLDDRATQRLVITTGAVATSGLRTRIWRTSSGYAHHLIDPATGEPAWTGVIQATALAPTALEAETLAKTALLTGPLAGRTSLERYGGALILDSGEAITVSPLRDRQAVEQRDRVTA